MKSTIFVILTLAVVSALLTYALILSVFPNNSATPADNNLSAMGSGTPSEMVVVRGNSLSPLLKPGDQVHLLSGYYDSHPVARGDIVAFRYAGDTLPVIKIAYALPGDRWGIEKDGANYRILVNGRALVNSENRMYEIPENSIKMLQLYAKDYPTLPTRAFLVLGDQVGGTLDSTRFGLLSADDILGKITR